MMPNADLPRCEIAVIVPVHNGANYLPDCLSAIAAQRFDDFRCILVDDGSTDGTPALCDAAAANDPRFLVIHQPQSGVSAARTAGVRRARELGAIWLAFCDADDCYHPDFLRTLHDAAQDAAMPLACCRYDTFTDTPAPDAAAPQGYRVLAAPAHLEALLRDHAVDYGLWNKLYAAGLLTEEMLDNGLAYNEDLLANWKSFLRAKGCATRSWRFCGRPLPPARPKRHPPRPAAPEHRRSAPGRGSDPRQRAGPVARTAADRQRLLL